VVTIKVNGKGLLRRLQYQVAVLALANVPLDGDGYAWRETTLKILADQANGFPTRHLHCSPPEIYPGNK
jgi:hypothetical protein